MKIGILTLYHNNYNYGGQLQAYALQKYLAENGNEAELIDYNQYPTNSLEVWLDRIWRNYRVLLQLNEIKQLREASRVNLENRLKYKRLLDQYAAKGTSCLDRFDDFISKLPHTKCFDRHSIKRMSAYYDAVVLGGDQIWNPDIFSKSYFAYWVKNKKKVLSYSASAGKDKLSFYELKRMKKLLRKIPSISVREENLCRLLRKVLDRNDIETVLDPVFLLNKNDWINITVKPRLDEKYIFTYLLNRDSVSREKITTYAKKHNLKIVTIPHVRGIYNICDEGFGDIVRYDVGPLEFLGLIANADTVFTDSFHGTCFSIIFHKEFYAVINSVDRENKTTNARLFTILSKVGLLDRLISCQEIGNNKKQINFTDVEYELNLQRKISRMWLCKALKNTLFS